MDQYSPGPLVVCEGAIGDVIARHAQGHRSQVAPMGDGVTRAGGDSAERQCWVIGFGGAVQREGYGRTDRAL